MACFHGGACPESKRYATTLDQATLTGEGGGAVLILTISAGSAAGGFWLGYVTTRTLLAWLFDLFARESPGDVQSSANPEHLKFDDQGGIIRPDDPNVEKTDQKLRALALETLTAPEDIAAWGAAQARSGNLREALRALHLAASKAPDDPTIQTLLDNVRTAYNRSSAAPGSRSDSAPASAPGERP